MVSLLNFFITRSVLERDLPEPTPEQSSEIQRYATISAILPGTSGLIVPFIARQQLTPPARDGGDGVDGRPLDGGGDGVVGRNPNEQIAAAEDLLSRATGLLESAKAAIENQRKETAASSQSGSQQWDRAPASSLAMTTAGETTDPKASRSGARGPRQESETASTD
jgi:hypothetical protein